jgi:hypothetical protein
VIWLVDFIKLFSSIAEFGQEPRNRHRNNIENADMTLGMALSGFHHHKRLTTMVRRDGDLGGRQGRLPRMSEKLFPMSPEKSYRYFWAGKARLLKRFKIN